MSACSGVAFRGLGSAAALLLALGRGVSAQDVAYNGSLQYATGSYVFSERTHSFYLFSGIGVDAGRFRVDASVPLVLQNSTLVTYVGGGPLPTGGADHEVVGNREPGMTIPGRRGYRAVPGTDSVRFRNRYDLQVGDPMLYGSVEVHSGTGVLRSVTVSAGTKLPLADLDSGVGTGEWDFSAGTSLSVALGDFLLFGDLSYWWLGDLPELELRDELAYGLGIGRPILNGRFSLLGSLSGAESAVETLDPPLLLSISLGSTIDGNRQVTGGVSAGLTESSPDVGVFLGWTIPL